MKTNLLVALVFLFVFSLKAQVEKLRDPNPTNNLYMNPNAIAKSPNPNHVYGKNQNSFVSSTFDTDWAERLQTVLDSSAAASGITGVSAALLAPGQGLWTGVSGISTEGVPITSEMRFGFASNTKLFIAITLAKMQEENILSLDDQLYQWLPSIPNVDSSVTIRQMLQHQSGISDYINDHPSYGDSIWADTSRFWTNPELLPFIGNPHFDIGQAYRYSNSNYFLAGLVIESATGKDWFQKVREVILDPLVMDSSFFGAFEPTNGPIANGHENNIEIETPPVTASWSSVHAAGSILSTPQEMVRWYDALFNGEIISESTLQEVLDFESISLAGLGVFEWTLFDYHHTYNHGGSWLGYLSQIYYDKESRSIICVATNTRNVGIGNITNPMFDVWLNEFPKKENDAGILEVINPWSSNCNSLITPVVKVKNFGNSILNSAIINYQIDGNTPALFNWSGSLNIGETIEVSLPELTISEGSHTFTCFTSQPNGEQEGYYYNDTASSSFIKNTSPSTITVLSENFDDDVFPPEGWTISSSSMFRWRKTSVGEINGTGALSKNNFNDDNIGTFHDISLPKIHISSGTNATIDFIYAYTNYPNYNGDSLQVLISEDCGLTWTKIFNKGGESLRTIFSMNVRFYPQLSNHWKEVSLSIGTEASDVLIKFRAICGFGNNLFIDDVNLSMVTSVNEEILSDGINIFPNPTSSEININGLSPGSEFQLTDLAGNVLMTQKATGNSTTINLSEFPNGIYFIRTKNGVKKIVKM